MNDASLPTLPRLARGFFELKPAMTMLGVRCPRAIGFWRSRFSGSLLPNGPAALTYGVKAAGIAKIAGRLAMSSFHDVPRAGRPDWRKYAFALAFGVATVIAALIQRYWF